MIDSVASTGVDGGPAAPGRERQGGGLKDARVPLGPLSSRVLEEAVRQIDPERVVQYTGTAVLATLLIRGPARMSKVAKTPPIGQLPEDLRQVVGEILPVGPARYVAKRSVVQGRKSSVST